MTAFRGPSASARSRVFARGTNPSSSRRQDDRLRAGEAHLVRERDPVGGVDPDAISRLEGGLRQEEEDVLSAAADHDLVRGEIRPVIVVKSLSHPRAQLRDSRGVDVVVKFSSSARLAAFLMGSGVLKSGSPGPKSMTSIPSGAPYPHPLWPAEWPKG